MQFRLRVYGPGRRQDFILPTGHFSIGRNPTGDNKLIIQATYMLDTHATLNTTEQTCTITVNPGQGSTHDTRCNDMPLPENRAVLLQDGDRLTIRAPAAPTQIVTLLFEQVQTALNTAIVATASALKPYEGQVPPGLKCQSLRLLQFLPEIYRPTTPLSWCDNCADGAHCTASFDTFLSRFLALFESILLPVEWTVTGFDQFLDPQTAPKDFLPWLEQWFALNTDWAQRWDEQQRRADPG